MTTKAPRRRRPRTCIGCRRHADRTELVRLRIDESPTATETAPGSLGLRFGLGGRGAWLCRDQVEACLELAQKRRAIGRAFRRTVPPAAVEQLLAELRLTGSEVNDRGTGG